MIWQFEAAVVCGVWCVVCGVWWHMLFVDGWSVFMQLFVVLASGWFVVECECREGVSWGDGGADAVLCVLCECAAADV